MMKKITVIILAVLLLTLFVLPSCKTAPEDTFKITLADTGEVVLTGNDIAVYDSENHSLELNASGITKWNSYLVDDSNPRSRNTLFSKDFIITIAGQEICQGKFWPAYSSYFLPEVIKITAVDRLDDEFNKLWLGFGGSAGATDIQASLTDYFKKAGRLK